MTLGLTLVVITVGDCKLAWGCCPPEDDLLSGLAVHCPRNTRNLSESGRPERIVVALKELWSFQAICHRRPRDHNQCGLTRDTTRSPATASNPFKNRPRHQSSGGCVWSERLLVPISEVNQGELWGQLGPIRVNQGSIGDQSGGNQFRALCSRCPLARRARVHFLPRSGWYCYGVGPRTPNGPCLWSGTCSGVSTYVRP